MVRFFSLDRWRTFLPRCLDGVVIRVSLNVWFHHNLFADYLHDLANSHNTKRRFQEFPDHSKIRILSSGGVVKVFAGAEDNPC
jgi:hypothetical protein